MTTISVVVCLSCSSEVGAITDIDGGDDGMRTMMGLQLTAVLCGTLLAFVSGLAVVPQPAMAAHAGAPYTNHATIAATTPATR